MHRPQETGQAPKLRVRLFRGLGPSGLGIGGFGVFEVWG